MLQGAVGGISACSGGGWLSHRGVLTVPEAFNASRELVMVNRVSLIQLLSEGLESC